MSVHSGGYSNFDRTFISPLERGVRSPTLRTLFRLSGHLGVKPSDILRRVESKVAEVDRAGQPTAIGLAAETALNSMRLARSPEEYPSTNIPSPVWPPSHRKPGDPGPFQQPFRHETVASKPAPKPGKRRWLGLPRSRTRPGALSTSDLLKDRQRNYGRAYRRDSGR